MSFWNAQAVCVSLCLLGLGRPPAQDGNAILGKGDQLLEEAKKAYEEAGEGGKVDRFVEAGFRLEEARIKFIVVQEIGTPELQKMASERLRSVQQLNKLINDGKVAVMKTVMPPSPGSSAPPPAGTPSSPPTGPTSPPPAKLVSRLPEPPAAEVKNADRLVRELFKEDFSKKGTEEKRALARKLLDQAAKTAEDPPGLYALCRAAIDAASQGCDPETVALAVEEMCKSFDLDRLSLRADALADAAKAARLPEESASLAEANLQLAEDLVLEDSYVAADKAVKAAMQHARRANQADLMRRVDERGKEIAESKSSFQAMKSSLQILAKTPDHGGANLEMGRFLCYVKGNWDLGLRFMVKGSDATLKSLAEKEITSAGQTDPLMALGEHWETLAEKERSSLRKKKMQDHARHLYEAALESSTGLLRAKIEKKLEELNAPPPTADIARLPGGAVNLMALISLDRDTVNGVWSMQGGILVSPEGVPAARVQIPYVPPDEYDLIVVVQKRAGDGAFNVVLVAGGSQFTIGIDSFGGAVVGLGLLDGKPGNANETTKSNSKVFVDNRPKTVVYKVRKNSLVVMAGTKTLMNWKASYNRCSLYPALSIPSREALAVMATTAQFAIQTARLVPVSGEGKLLYPDR